MKEKNNNDKQLIVKKINNGIVIDHIASGSSFYVLRALKIDDHFPHSVFVAMNVPSKKLGRKDVLKWEIPTIKHFKNKSADHN